MAGSAKKDTKVSEQEAIKPARRACARKAATNASELSVEKKTCKRSCKAKSADMEKSATLKTDVAPKKAAGASKDAKEVKSTAAKATKTASKSSAEAKVAKTSASKTAATNIAKQASAKTAASDTAKQASAKTAASDTAKQASAKTAASDTAKQASAKTVAKKATVKTAEAKTAKATKAADSKSTASNATVAKSSSAKTTESKNAAKVSGVKSDEKKSMSTTSAASTTAKSAARSKGTAAKKSSEAKVSAVASSATVKKSASKSETSKAVSEKTVSMEAMVDGAKFSRKMLAPVDSKREIVRKAKPSKGVESEFADITLLNKQERFEVMRLLEEQNPNPKSELNFNNPFELLCAVVLSAQATDESVNKATPALFKAAPDAKSMAALGADGIAPYIQKIGLWKNKAKFLEKLSRELDEKYDGKVPETMEELIALPGVGSKTAKVVLNVAFGQPFLAVDTHVFRVCGRIGLCLGHCPGDVENKIPPLIDERFMKEAHHYLLLHGRYHCTARKFEEHCANCVVAKYCKHNY